MYQSTGTYASSHLKNEKGISYHKAFSKQPGRNIIWEQEIKILIKILSDYGPFNLHLDFAGGTGRIADALTKYIQNQIILDISEEMLSIAKKNLKNATIICKDFRDCQHDINNNSIDIVTAFRFFSNAENDLRYSAINFLSRVIKKNGLLVCNNHRNFWSIPYTINRLLFLNGDVGMLNRTMIELANKSGFDFINSYSLGIIPQSEKRSIFPWSFIKFIENKQFKIADKHTLGYNTIFIFRKK